MNIRKITTDSSKVTCQGMTSKCLLAFFVLGAFFQAIFCHQAMGDRYVAESGSDIGNDCSDPGAPCATVRYAIYVATNQAETIHIANGIYRDPGIVLRNEMTLVGNGAANSIIQAASVPGMVTSRVVSVSAGITGTLSRLTFRYGYSTNDGGGLWNAGRLTLSECRVLDCESEGYGGGIENQGYLILSNSLIAGCTSWEDGGGLRNAASGIVMVAQCAISNNLAQDDGGGIENLGYMTIKDSTIAKNRATDKGGGLRNHSTLIASNMFVYANHATSRGGGIYNINQMQLFQCIVSNNSLHGVNGSSSHPVAFSALGAGIYNNGDETLVDCSVEYNYAWGGRGYSSSGAGGHGKGGGLYCLHNSTILKSSIAHNRVWGGGSSRGGEFGRGQGGGLYSDGTLMISNSPVVNNTASAGGFERDMTSNLGQGGGLYLSGTASLLSCPIVSNTCRSSANLTKMGGGIYVSGIVTARLCNIEQNTADGWEGWYDSNGIASSGLPASGGGVCNAGKLWLLHCSVSSNFSYGGPPWGYYSGGSAYGAGLVNVGQLFLDYCRVDRNQAVGANGGTPYGSSGAAQGAGLYNRQTVTIDHSSFCGNITHAGSRYHYLGATDSSGYGGALYNSGTCFVANTTFALNEAHGGSGFGGACYNKQDSHLSMNYCTIANNQVTFRLNGHALGGGLFNDVSANGTSGTIDVQNTLLSGNIAASDGADCYGPLFSMDYNLIASVSGCILTGATNHTIVGVDGQLAPLAWNGGPTPTQALLPGSPAIDAGASLVTSTDQRGAPRPIDMPGVANVDDGSDIGAYEAGGTDLSVVKHAEVQEFGTNHWLVYEVSAWNLGVSNLSNIVLQDFLPPEIALHFITNSFDSCTVTSSTVTCTQALLPVGEGRTLMLYTKITAPPVENQVVNRAWVTTDTPELTTSNNQTAVTTEILDHDGDGTPDYADADNDNDGMPDDFESAYGLNRNDAIDAARNADGDVHNNLQEYIADTDPLDSNSYFRITMFSNSVSAAINFYSSSNRLYSLLSCADLSSNVWSVVTGAGPRMGIGGADLVQDTNQPLQSKYYRIEVQLP